MSALKQLKAERKAKKAEAAALREEHAPLLARAREVGRAISIVEAHIGTLDEAIDLLDARRQWAKNQKGYR